MKDIENLLKKFDLTRFDSWEIKEGYSVDTPDIKYFSVNGEILGIIRDTSNLVYERVEDAVHNFSSSPIANNIVWENDNVMAAYLPLAIQIIVGIYVSLPKDMIQFLKTMEESDRGTVEEGSPGCHPYWIVHEPERFLLPGEHYDFVRKRGDRKIQMTLKNVNGKPVLSLSNKQKKLQRRHFNAVVELLEQDFTQERIEYLLKKHKIGVLEKAYEAYKGLKPSVLKRWYRAYHGLFITDSGDNLIIRASEIGLKNILISSDNLIALYFKLNIYESHKNVPYREVLENKLLSLALSDMLNYIGLIRTECIMPELLLAEETPKPKKKEKYTGSYTAKFESPKLGDLLSLLQTSEIKTARLNGRTPDIRNK